MGVSMERISDLARGRLRLELTGAFPAGVLNAAAQGAVELWDVESVDVHTLRFSAYENRLQELQAAADRAGCELKLLFRSGGRRGRSRLLRRPALLLGLAAALLGLLVSSLFVWDIDVRGLDRLSRGQVLRALEDSGFSVGSFWPGLSTEQLESAVMLRLPQIGWMSVNVSGSRAIVMVCERQEKPEMYDSADGTDLVAVRSGLIRRVNVLAGRQLVRPGELVTEGETLVSGTLESLAGEGDTVCARGSVMAETWYEITALHPKEEALKTPRTVGRSRFALLLGKRRLNLYFSSGNAIDGCDKIISEYTLGVGDLFSLPVRIVKETRVPYTVKAGEDYDPSAAARRLYALLEGQTEGQILSHSMSPGQSGACYTLTLRAHCSENIAQPVKHGG